MSRLSGVLRRVFGGVKQCVGSDQFGNKYYYIPEHKSWTGQVVRARRLVEACNPAEFEYLEGNIPSEWDAWIRGRRKDPPTIEELVRNEEYREQIKLKAQEVEERDQVLQIREEQPVQTQVKGHAAAAQYGRPEISPDPVSTANTFTPGSWSPNKKS
ncbi:NADH dehydrogenase [ubiquinone] 1 alpha subcomplex assembly factor 2 [Astyanax mexicanus]|uniref:NADH dehydrogenase ubiquinone 1 alpha subcomplex assembly factor 2 n=2 Tax=Astyanax mexicanus TaxID=7994 RepID=A0A8B9HW56_ASTMX|nr:NADH dehydrogenase [ubiquinone] 1 alpha subcomplex assembly factor 2 [Astyanax mexicanus]KAG9270938.1 NADH dehydrogenase ubiquinone 1 alpha subcomplex assembly factor 2 [Astyanax mexicanus]